MNPALIFALSLLTGGVFTWLVRAFALKNNIVNKPNPIVPQHVRPVAYLGGLGIFLGSLSAIGITHYSGDVPLSEVGIGLCATGFLILGIFDDLKVYSARKKFIIQLVLAVAGTALGIKAEFVGIPVVDFFLSALWILVLVNAANLTDVCDGLVGGLMLITFLFIGISGQEPASFAILVAGSIGGFLIFNLPRASIFLGDAGSHLLGFLLAAFTLLHFHQLPAGSNSIPFLLIPGVMLFELIFLTVVRIQKGLAWWKGSPDHFSLRLQAAGFTRWQTDAIAWTAQATILLIAFLLPRQCTIIQLVLAALLAAGVLVSWKYLLRHEVKR